MEELFKGLIRKARGPRHGEFCSKPGRNLGDTGGVIIAVGNDLMEVARMRDALDRLGARFERRIFTDRESAYCRRRYNFCQSFAARFAAKEAVMKALGTGWRRGVRWVDIEVCRNPGEAPRIELHGAAAEHASRRGIARFLLTLTHTDELAEAVVIAVSKE